MGVAVRAGTSEVIRAIQAETSSDKGIAMIVKMILTMQIIQFGRQLIMITSKLMIMTIIIVRTRLLRRKGTGKK